MCVEVPRKMQAVPLHVVDVVFREAMAIGATASRESGYETLP